jgi:hypothetical protein
VGDRGEQVLGDLWLLVMRHPDARGAAERGRAAPLGDAAALGGVEVDEVDRARVEAWFSKYGTVPPDLAKALEAASGIPVDIDPISSFPEPMH